MCKSAFNHYQSLGHIQVHNQKRRGGNLNLKGEDNVSQFGLLFGAIVMSLSP